MSDQAQGPGWWQASTGKWYPPQHALGVPMQVPETPLEPETGKDPMTTEWGDSASRVGAMQVLLPDRAGQFPGHADYAGAEFALLGQVLEEGSGKTLPDEDTRRAPGW